MVGSSSMERMRSRLGFWGGVSVDPVGLSGGMCLWWRRGVIVDVWATSRFLIHVIFRGNALEPEWSCFCVHAPTRATDQRAFWEDLVQRVNRVQHSWGVIGDLNQIIDQSEKIGGSQVKWGRGKVLRDFMFSTGGVDLGAQGGRFTWSNGRQLDQALRERLDRAIVSANWCVDFPRGGLRNLPILASDHAPILLNTHLESENLYRPFRFFEAWSADPGCRARVFQAWQQRDRGQASYVLHQKTCRTRRYLKKWSTEHFNGQRRRLKFLEQKLVAIQNQQPTTNNLTEEGEVIMEIEVIRDFMEKCWKQKSRELWLRDGDRNTKFFHSSTVVRRKRNHIWSILEDDGRLLNTRVLIEKYFNDHFTQLFTSSNPSFPEDLEGLVTPEIAEEDNERLTATPTDEEIKECVWSMNPSKAPGVDGFQGVFYRSYWDIVGPQVCDFVKDFFGSGKLLKALNRTNIVLIPKMPNAASFDKFRPISLCNFSLKIITKIITARLKPLLSKIVSPFQTGFVPGRWIAENAVLAREVMHVMKRKKGKGGLMAIKLDMHKAYDRMEWSFILKVLDLFGFSKKFIKLVQQCISTVSFSILLNGSPCNPFIPTRGLRQGDPLSPFLFIIGAEILSRLILRKEREKSIHGIKIGRSVPPISHLMFADDCFLFCRVNLQEIEHLKQCLSTYEAWSGQMVSKQKSGIVFSNNVSRIVRQNVMQSMSMPELNSDISYLGSPLFVGRNKTASFEALKTKVHNRLEGWMNKTLSRAGKATLIKSVVQAIPTYAMSTFKLPKHFNEDLDRMMRRFWWAGDPNKNRCLTLQKWDTLCQPKCSGGLGFRKMDDYNSALLAKIGWALASKQQSLLVELLSAKYCTRESFLSCSATSSASQGWRDILSSAELIKANSAFLIGSGTQIRIFEDAWIKNGAIISASSSNLLDENQRVAALFVDGSRVWDRGKLESWFDSTTIEAILETRVRPEPLQDLLVWKTSKAGVFSVKGAYIAAHQNRFQQRDPWWKVLWKIKIPERVRLLLWRISHDKLPTLDLLARRNLTNNTLCPLCSSTQENILHVLWACPFARSIWFASNGVPSHLDQVLSAQELLKVLFNSNDKDQSNRIPMFAFILDEIWLSRNSLVFSGIKADPLTSLNRISNRVREWEMLSSNQKDSESVQQTFPNKLRLLSETKWRPPSEDVIKINVDAAYNTKGAHLGVIARNFKGNPLLIWVGQAVAVSSMEAELLAIERGISLAKTKGWNRIIVEGDCKPIMEALQKGNSSPDWKLTPVLEDIRSKASNSNCSFAWINRDRNLAADALAKWAASSNFVGFPSFGELPTPVGNSIFSDLI